MLPNKLNLRKSFASVLGFFREIEPLGHVYREEGL